MKARVKTREIEATRLGNGNWLIEDGGVRQSLRADDFHRLYELADCSVDSFSSRMCEHGTNGCVVNHALFPELCPACRTTPYELVTNDGFKTVREIRCACRQ